MSGKRERLTRQAEAKAEAERSRVDERTRDRHSVGCYFCGVEFDERDGQNADDYNNGDGGSICPACLPKDERKAAERRVEEEVEKWKEKKE